MRMTFQPKKRVLHVIETLGHGGAEHQLALVVSALDRERYENIVCHLFPPEHLAARIRGDGVEVIGLGLVRGKKSLPAAIARLVGLIRARKIDLLHTSLFQADLAGGIAAKLCGVPAVNTLCNVYGGPERVADNKHMSPLKHAATMRLWGATQNRCFRRSIAISQAVRESAAENMGRPREAMTVIYRAFTDPPRASVDRGALKRSLGIEDGSPILLNVGRLAPQKGQKYLLAAMPAILAQFPRAQLLIAGEGWLRGELSAQIQALKLEAHVKLLGRREDTRALIETADQFVFPSLFEGLGVALIEAAGLGSTCVAARVGPIPEVIEHDRSGVLVPPRDPHALAAAINALAGDPARARALGDAARARIHSEFTVARMISALETVYDGILEGGDEHGSSRRRARHPQQRDGESGDPLAVRPTEEARRAHPEPHLSPPVVQR